MAESRIEIKEQKYEIKPQDNHKPVLMFFDHCERSEAVIASEARQSVVTAMIHEKSRFLNRKTKTGLETFSGSRVDSKRSVNGREAVFHVLETILQNDLVRDSDAVVRIIDLDFVLDFLE